MIGALLALAVLGACAPGLPPEGEAARDALDRTLAEGEAERVAEAARAAMRWRGRDAALDRLLGEALATALGEPAEGLWLLRSRPAPDDPRWRRAVAAAALRVGDPAELRRVAGELGLDLPPDLDAPVVERVVLAARDDPRVGWEDLLDAGRGCALLARARRRGLGALDLPAPPTLPEAARAAGADGVAVGRVARPRDRRRTGRPWTCDGLVYLGDDALPGEDAPRSVVVVADFEGAALSLWLRRVDDGWWTVAATDPEAAAAWVRAALDAAESP